MHCNSTPKLTQTNNVSSFVALLFIADSSSIKKEKYYGIRKRLKLINIQSVYYRCAMLKIEKSIRRLYFQFGFENATLSQEYWKQYYTLY